MLPLILLLAALPRNDRLQAEHGPFAEGASLYEWKLVEALVPWEPNTRRHVVMVTVPSRGASEESVYVLVHDDSLEVVARRLEPRLSLQINRGADGGFERIEGSAKEEAIFRLKPSVETARAPISKATFERLDELWNAALSQVEQPRPDYSEELVVGADGTHYHFANTAPGVDYLDGEVWSPEAGTGMRALVEVGQTLAEYARADPARRPSFEKKLLASAAALLLRLRQPQRGQ